MQDFQDFDVDVPWSPKRRPPEFPWGIYVISAVCGLVTLLGLSLVFSGDLAKQVFGGGFAVLSLVLCVGIALRVNAFRLLLLVLLYLSYVADIPLVVYAWHLGRPIQFGRIFLRMGLTVATILYLQKPVVRMAFVGEDSSPPSQTWKKLTSRVTKALVGSMWGFAAFLALLIANNTASLGIGPDLINVLFLGLFFLGGLVGLIVRLFFGTDE